MSRCSSIVLMMYLCAPATACLSAGDDPSATGGTVGPGWESATTTTDDGAILIQRVAYRSGGLLILGAAIERGTDLAGRGKQLRSLGPDDHQVFVFSGGSVLGGIQLHDLALGDHGGGRR